MTRRPRASALAVVALVAAIWGGWRVFGPGPAAATGGSTDVELPTGGGLAGTGRALADARVVPSAIEFEAAAVLGGGAAHLQAGEYLIPSGASLWRILGMVRRGEVVRRFVTIPEGLTSRAAVEILDHTDFLTGDVRPPPEGAILPETYEVKRGETRAHVLARMTGARDKLLTSLWRARRPGLPFRSPAEAVTLASVVEKETALPRERPRIAAVFINRLEKGMRLESDPTVIYGLTGGVPLGHGLRASELASVTPYNTYKVAGLPPTPIANPGRAALAAALDPAPTNDLFFVADGTGGHVFAASFEDHKRNVAHWRDIERQRGGSGTP